MAGVFALLVFYSYLHKYLIKPSLKRFKKDKNDDDYDEEEPQPRRKKAVKSEPIINEVEVIKENPIIEAKTVKQLPEEVMDVKASPEESKEQIKHAEISTEKIEEKLIQES